MDSVIENTQIQNVSVSDAAKVLGKSPQFVRIGLQRQLLPFGVAVQMSSKWTYHISPKLLKQYVGE
ncbi:MAG: hypothetical protein RR595_05610 [Lysinibacillus sp.]